MIKNINSDVIKDRIKEKNDNAKSEEVAAEFLDPEYKEENFRYLGK